MEECPTCDREFDTERALKIHHSKAHGESISGVEITCEYCGDTYSKSPSEADRSRFCSRDCQAAHQSDTIDSPFGGERNGVHLTCERCGEEYRRAAANAEGSRFCSRECQSAAQSVEFSNEDWHLSGTTGPQHPAYTGHEDYYGENWTEQRKAALERDGIECVVCGMGQEEHQDTHGCDLHVHHVQPIATFETPEEANSLENLLTLCRACHTKWEGIPVAPEVVGRERHTDAG
jgi:uncharacterized C2H2 Zn-finger protein